MAGDNWGHRADNMKCRTCMYFVPKVVYSISPGPEPVELANVTNPESKVGRCRRNAPTMKGWPVLFADDWCGEHKLDETKI